MAYHVRGYADGVMFYDSSISEEAYQVSDLTIDEEINKNSTANFTIFPSNPVYDSLRQMVTQIVIETDKRVLFRGRVISYEDDVWGQRSVKCEDALSYLMDSVFLNDKATAKISGAAVATSSEDQEGDKTSDILAIVQRIADKDYEGAAQDGWQYLTAAASEVWSGIKSNASYVYNKVTSGGSVSDIISGIAQDYMNSLTDTATTNNTAVRMKERKETAYQFLSRVLLSHNIQVDRFKWLWPGRVTIDEAEELKHYGSESICDSRTVIDNALIKQYGGHLHLRVEKDPETGEELTFLDYLKEYDTECKQMLQLGVNIEELNYTEETENIFTVLMPIGKNNGTIVNVNDGSMFLEIPELIAKYGRIIMIKQWEDYTDANQLKEEALKFIEKRRTGIPVKMDVTAVDMHVLDEDEDEIEIGNIVNVYAPSRGIDLYKTVLKIKRDLKNPENNSYEIGDEDWDDEATTGAYKGKDYTLTNLLGEVDKSGVITRDGIKFDIKDTFDVTANRINLRADQAQLAGFGEYDETKKYSKNDKVFIDGALYSRKSDGPEEGEPFDPTKWKKEDAQLGVLYMSSLLEQHTSDLIEIYTNMLDIYARSRTNSQALLHLQEAACLDITGGSNRDIKKGEWVKFGDEFFIAREAVPAQADYSALLPNEGYDKSQYFARPGDENGFIGINAEVFVTKAYIQDLVVEKLNATIATIEQLNSDLAQIRQGSFNGVHANYVQTSSASIGILNGSTPVTDATLIKKLTWANIVDKPSFRTISFVDREGNVIHAYGP